MAFHLWLWAVALGACETALEVGRAVASDANLLSMLPLLLIRILVFSLAIYVAIHMRRGAGWARLTLAIGLGFFGLLSMIVQPIQRLFDGAEITTIIQQSGAIDLLFGASRTVHITAVVCAVVLMFLPLSHSYFRSHKSESKAG